MTTQIKLRRDTGTNWDANSTVVLAAGEIGVNLTNGQFKLGNGTSTWAELTYFQPGAGGGLTISDFGEGFGLDNSDKIVTNKLYSTNETQPNQHYRLTLDTNGVVHLPDESIINGATLKSVPGNYAGITAGPVGHDEDSWMWVDSTGAFIATKYNTGNAKTWSFDNTGVLTLPEGGDIVNSTGSSVLGGGGASTGDWAFSGNVAYNSVSVDSGLYVSPGGEGTSYVYVPGNSQSSSQAIIIGNTAQTGQVTVNAYNNNWQFNADGTLAIPGGSWTKTTNNVLNNSVLTKVVWTSSNNFISGAKLTIQVEAEETGGIGQWETQVCEAIIAVRGYTNTSQPVMTVYGVTHTSVAPLMTFTIQRNPSTSLIEIVGTRTGTASPNNNASLRIYSVETGTND